MECIKNFAPYFDPLKLFKAFYPRLFNGSVANLTELEKERCLCILLVGVWCSDFRQKLPMS